MGGIVVVFSGIGRLLCKGPDGKYFRLCGPASVTATQLCWCRAKEAADKMTTNEHGCVPIKLYLQEHVVGLDLAHGPTLLPLLEMVFDCCCYFTRFSPQSHFKHLGNTTVCCFLEHLSQHLPSSLPQHFLTGVRVP